MRYLLIMGQSFLREAICSFLDSELTQVDLLVTESAEEFRALPEAERAEVSLALLYAGVHDAGDEEFGHEFAAARAALGDIPIVLIGDRTETNQIDRAIRLGAKGYIPAVAPAEIVKHVLPLIANGCIFAPPFLHGSMIEALEQSPDPEQEQPEPADLENHQNGDFAELESSVFTKRENEVLKLLATGLQNKIIAHKLGLKESTVKVHIRHILRKLKVTSRTQAALIAQSRNHLLPEETS